MWWCNNIYIDVALPFGLRSAPNIFSSLVDGLLWILHSKNINLLLRYLDDFLLLGRSSPGSPECGKALQTILGLCEALWIPVARGKKEGPATKLTLLRIEIDTEPLQLHLPQDKLERLSVLLGHWMQGGPTPRRSGTKRDLLSLIGLLNHAAAVVWPCRPFMRSLIHAASAVKVLTTHVHLTAKVRAGIAWWHAFSGPWNGISLLPPAEPSQVIYSDAAGSWGCGASLNYQ